MKSAQTDVGEGMYIRAVKVYCSACRGADNEKRTVVVVVVVTGG